MPWRITTASRTASCGMWKAVLRISNLEQTIGSRVNALIMYIGASTHGEDGILFLQKHGTRIANMHVYEPVKPFFDELTAYYNTTHGAITKGKVHLHAYGLGKDERIITIPKSALAGQASFLMDGKAGGADTSDTLELQIKNASKEMLRVMAESGRDHIDLLHANCEGCEWEMMAQLAALDMFRKIRVIQISMHFFPIDRAAQLFIRDYCDFWAVLSRTHDEVDGHPFGWQRFVCKKEVCGA
jgi:hypothetical protein